MILIDTSVLSVVLRRRERHLNPDQQRIATELYRLHKNGEALLVAPVRQEILTGIKTPEQLQSVRERVDTFDTYLPTLAEFDLAAECHTRCQAAGMAATAFDMLICAIAVTQDLAIFTADLDFSRYQAKIAIRLHVP